MQSFSDLGLSENLIQNIKKIGYEKPFPIQEKAIPAILTGKDVMGIGYSNSRSFY